MVKTIGDAVMATFPTPDRRMAAALRMREAMRELNEQHGSEDLLLKIGIHEGPCLAVMLNERQDYFGQTVNIAARVQGLADRSRSWRPRRSSITRSRRPARRRRPEPRWRSTTSLRGVASEVAIYEIP